MHGRVPYSHYPKTIRSECSGTVSYALPFSRQDRCVLFRTGIGHNHDPTVVYSASGTFATPPICGVDRLGLAGEFDTLRALPQI